MSEIAKTGNTQVKYWCFKNVFVQNLTTVNSTTSTGLDRDKALQSHSNSVDDKNTSALFWNADRIYFKFHRTWQLWIPGQDHGKRTSQWTDNWLWILPKDSVELKETQPLWRLFISRYTAFFSLFFEGLQQNLSGKGGVVALLCFLSPRVISCWCLEKKRRGKFTSSSRSPYRPKYWKIKVSLKKKKRLGSVTRS